MRNKKNVFLSFSVAMGCIVISIILICIFCIGASWLLLREFAYGLEEVPYPPVSKEVVLDEDTRLTWLYADSKLTLTIEYKGISEDFSLNQPNYYFLNIYYNPNPENPYFRFSNEYSFYVDLKTMEQQYVAVGDDKVFTFTDAKISNNKYGVQCINNKSEKKYYEVDLYTGEQIREAITINNSEKFVGIIEWTVIPEDRFKFYHSKLTKERNSIDKYRDNFIACGEEYFFVGKR